MLFQNCILILLTVLLAGNYNRYVISQNLVGGHLNHPSNASTEDLKVESRIMSTGAHGHIDKKNQINFPDDDNDIEVPKIQTMPTYNLPDEIFNNGRPFYVDKDPETGKPDFSTKRTSILTDHDHEDGHGHGQDDQELRLSNINHLTPNFHDYLNLPTKYNPEKFLYPIISSSYANMKIQGNTQKDHTKNHKLEITNVRTPQLTTNMHRHAIKTTTTPTPMTKSTTSSPTTKATTTTTTFPKLKVTTKKPVSFIEQLFDSFVNEDDNIYLSSTSESGMIEPRTEETTVDLRTETDRTTPTVAGTVTVTRSPEIDNTSTKTETSTVPQSTTVTTEVPKFESDENEVTVDSSYEEPITVKAYTVKSTTEVAPASNPSFVLSVPSNQDFNFNKMDPQYFDNDDTLNYNVSSEDDTQLITKPDATPLRYQGVSSQGVIKVKPDEDTGSLVIGNHHQLINQQDPVKYPHTILPDHRILPNNYINRRLDANQQVVHNNNNNDSSQIMVFNTKPFAHPLPPSGDLVPPRVQNVMYKKDSILVPAKVFIEQRLPPPTKQLPNILPQFKPNNRYRPQFLSDHYPPQTVHNNRVAPTVLPQRRIYMQRDKIPAQQNIVPSQTQIQYAERKRFDVRVPTDNNHVYYQTQHHPPTQIRNNDQVFVDDESGLYKEPPRILVLEPKHEVKTLQMLKNFDNSNEGKPVVEPSQDGHQPPSPYVVYPAANKATNTPARLDFVNSNPSTEDSVTTPKISTTTSQDQSAIALRIGMDDAADQTLVNKPVYEVYPNSQNDIFSLKKAQAPNFDANYYMNNKNYYPSVSAESAVRPTALEFEAPFFPSTSYEINREQWKAVKHDGDKFQDRSDDFSTSTTVSTNNNNNNNNINNHMDATTKAIDLATFSPHYEGGFQPIFPNSEAARQQNV